MCEVPDFIVGVEGEAALYGGTDVAEKGRYRHILKAFQVAKTNAENCVEKEEDDEERGDGDREPMKDDTDHDDVEDDGDDGL